MFAHLEKKVSNFYGSLILMERNRISAQIQKKIHKCIHLFASLQVGLDVCKYLFLHSLLLQNLDSNMICIALLHGEWDFLNVHFKLKNKTKNVILSLRYLSEVIWEF